MTKTEAMQVVLDAACHWRDELVEYIAPASEEFGDDESAESQRENADEIDQAIVMLRKELYGNG